jgi:hypothetical protein
LRIHIHILGFDPVSLAGFYPPSFSPAVVMSGNGFPVTPPSPPPPADITASSVSYYDATKAIGRLLIALAVGVFTTIIQAGGYLVRGLVWLFAAVVPVATWPLVQLFKLLQFLLSPVTYTLSYVFAPLVSFVSFVGRLRPLYTYVCSPSFRFPLPWYCSLTPFPF